MPTIDVGLNITAMNNATAALKAVIADLEKLSGASENLAGKTDKASKSMKGFGENVQATKKPA